MPVPSTMIGLSEATVVDAVRPRQLGDGAHHRHGPGAEHQSRFAFLGDQLVEALGDESVEAVAAIVGAGIDGIADWLRVPARG